MTTDDYLLDELERTQFQRTRRRRDQRSRRRRLLAVIVLAMSLLGLLGLPSLVCHTPVARTLLARSAASHDLDAEASAIRIGWITPLRINGLALHGRRGESEIEIEQLTAGLTVSDWLTSGLTELGEVTLRGVAIRSELRAERLSLEDDFPAWFEPSGGATTTSGQIRLQDVSLEIHEPQDHEPQDQRRWRCAQVAAEIELAPEGTEATFAGVLTAPDESSGSIEGSYRCSNAEAPGWQLECRGESVPLGFTSLLRRRFAETAAALPSDFSGDASGSVVLVAGQAGAVEADLRGVEVRNLVASDPTWGERRWRNQLATIDGDLVLREDRVLGRRLQATTDFAAASLDGTLASSLSVPGTDHDPVGWLNALQGTATARIDLAALDAAMPGLIPLRDGVELISGKIHAKIETTGDPSRRRSELAVRSDAVRARARGRAVAIEPIDVTATVRNDDGAITAEEFRWNSSFASAVGNGDRRSGSADLEVNFGRLATMLRPLVEVSEANLGGTVKGNLRWSVSSEDGWTLAGEGTADDLLIAVGDGRTLRRPKLSGGIDAEGRWGEDSLQELSTAQVRISGSGLQVSAELARPVREPSSRTPLPLHLTGQGRVEELVSTLRPWLPANLKEAGGGFSLQGDVELSPVAARLLSLDAVLHEPHLIYGDGSFGQPEITLHFEGEAGFPGRDAVVRKLTIAGDALSAAAQGQVSPEHVDLELAWRCKLQRLQSSLRPRVSAQTDSTIRRVSYRPDGPAVDDQWWLLGDCDGNVQVRGDGELLRIETHAAGQDLTLLQPADIATAPMVGPRRQQDDERSNNAATDSRVVWSEPNVKLDGELNFEPTSGRVSSDSLRVVGDWFATTLQGHAQWDEVLDELKLQGPAEIKTEVVARRLSSLAGTTIEASGIHGTDFELQATRGDDGELSFAIDATLGWEGAAVAGVHFGETTVPVRMTETSVTVAPAAMVPVEQGAIHVGGQVHYRPGPLWLQARPGSIADSVRLTPEMTNRWLKFIAPLAADATRIDGTFSATIEEAIVVFDRPELSRVRGRLELEGVEMAAGPLTDRIIAGVQQLQAFQSLPGFNPQQNGTRKLVSLPPQSVEFSLADNVVHHQRLKMEIDRAEVITSGSVSLDGGLNLFAQVPLDRRWLGSDLQFLAGESVTLPISGTFDRPTLDRSGVRDIARQVGTQAVQDASENFLQDQLDRGQQQINRGLERGMERLGLDRIFGREPPP